MNHRKQRQLVLAVLSVVLVAAFQNCGKVGAAVAQSDLPSIVTTVEDPGGYVLTLTNGGNMPFSPPILWIATARAGVPTVGTDSTPGQRKVCESGDSSSFNSELALNPDVLWIHRETAPILPGQSTKIEVPGIDASLGESLYFDFMYGKTKNICGGVFDLDFELLSDPLISGLRGGDSVFSSGAFARPSVSNFDNPDCTIDSTAVACLRSLSSPLSGEGNFLIRSFVGYSPSVFTSIESVFGADQIEQLLVPTSGALTYQLEEK